MFSNIELRNGELRLVCNVADLIRGASIETMVPMSGLVSSARVVVDLRHVRRVDAYGLGIMLAAATRARAAGSTFELAAVTAIVQELIEICGLAAHLNPGQDDGRCRRYREACAA